MSEIYQNIIVAIIGLIAIAFLIRKYIWSPKKKNSKSCGNDGCGC
ncbi:MAG: FtsZ-interacting cell division protein ZipA [Glaciecola sp.]|jgi:FtsZ-interacting cell division protein ZipA